MPTTNNTDAFLIKDYMNGNENALEVLIKTHQTNIYEFIQAKILDKDLANDVFQDTFIKIIKVLKTNSYNEEGKFFSFATRIAHNLVMDHFRRQQKMPMLRETEDFSIFSKISDGSLSIENQIITEQIKKDLEKLIKELPDEQKEVVMMRIYGELSFKEIAELKGISIGTALGRMRYALTNLRKRVKENQIVLTI